MREVVRIILAAVAICFIAAAHASADSPRPCDSEARAANYAVMLTNLTNWITENSDLSPTGKLPELKFINPGMMATCRQAVMSKYQAADSRIVDDGTFGIVAFYDRKTATIFLSSDWDGSDLADKSILVHELVHHLDASTEDWQPSMDGGERLAYDLQDRFLQANGSDLFTALGIDPFSRLMLSEWLY